MRPYNLPSLKHILVLLHKIYACSSSKWVVWFLSPFDCLTLCDWLTYRGSGWWEWFPFEITIITSWKSRLYSPRMPSFVRYPYKWPLFKQFRNSGSSKNSQNAISLWFLERSRMVERNVTSSSRPKYADWPWIHPFLLAKLEDWSVCCSLWSTTWLASLRFVAHWNYSAGLISVAAEWVESKLKIDWMVNKSYQITQNITSCFESNKLNIHSP